MQALRSRMLMLPLEAEDGLARLSKAGAAPAAQAR
jgi:hypothetical protein